MPVHEFEKLVNAPASNPKSQIPKKAKALRIIKPTNPYKPLWGFISTSALGLAYLLNQARARKLLEFMPQYRQEVKQSWLLGKINAINQARKVEYAANLDWELWQFGADRAARAKQLSVLSPQEIALFQEQARQQAMLEQGLVEQSIEAPPTLPHGTPGTIDDITQPSDKIVGGLPKSPEELIEALRAECKGLYKLIKSHPVRIVGVQRTGKTTLARKLALIRLIIIPDHSVVAVTPHREKGNTYPSVFDTVGLKRTGVRDNVAIANQWMRFYQGIQNSEHTNQTTIWDEYGSYGEAIGEEKLGLVVGSTLRESMKFEAYPIFVAHGETARFLPGGKGAIKAFLDGTIRVESVGEPVVNAENGLEEMKPTGKFQATFLDGTVIHGKIPEWLTEDFLLSLGGFGQAEHSVNPSEPRSTQELNALWDNKVGDREPAEPADPFDPFYSQISSEERGFVVSFRRSGMSKDEVILKVWGTKKGGSKGYKAAKAKLDRILREASID
ncbi:MAG: ATP-binding protein [Symploca sp. SIO3E6]|nr:ATP-binding protein [Caldora sp. SIO3E6]